MRLSNLTWALGIVTKATGGNGARSAPELEKTAAEEDKDHHQFIHFIEPVEDGNDTDTSRGPGGYTDDKETWVCLDDSNITSSDCEAVQGTVRNNGDTDGWWWISGTMGCNSWQYGNCKATFCPRDPDKDDEDGGNDGDGEREPMVVSTWRLARNMDLITKVCGEDGRRGYIKADNGTWEFWVAEAWWEQGGG